MAFPIPRVAPVTNIVLFAKGRRFVFDFSPVLSSILDGDEADDATYEDDEEEQNPLDLPKSLAEGGTIDSDPNDIFISPILFILPDPHPYPLIFPIPTPTTFPRAFFGILIPKLIPIPIPIFIFTPAPKPQKPQSSLDPHVSNQKPNQKLNQSTNQVNQMNQSSPVQSNPILPKSTLPYIPSQSQSQVTIPSLSYPTLLYSSPDPKYSYETVYRDIRKACATVQTVFVNPGRVFNFNGSN